MRKPLLALFGIALLAASGSLAGVAAARKPVPPLTGLEAGPWARADAVLHARVERVLDVRAPGGTKGRQVVHAKVLAVYKGLVKKDTEITLVVLGQRPTLDPAQPSLPYFRSGQQTRHVLFLGRADGAFAWRLQTLYDAEGRAGAQRVRAVEAVATWSAQTEIVTKAQLVVKDLLRMLGSGGAWTKTHAARELAWLARARPESFSRKDQSRLRRTAPLATSSDQRFWLRRTLTSIAARASTAKRDVVETDPWRRTFLGTTEPTERAALLTHLLHRGGALYKRHAWWAWRRLEPSLRVAFVDALASAKRLDEAASLRRAYGTEDETEVRGRIVRALGFLGGDADVAWLIARTNNERLRRSALLALARIGSPLARLQLKAARSAPWSTDDLRAWIDHLLSPEFQEAERRRG